MCFSRRYENSLPDSAFSLATPVRFLCGQFDLADVLCGRLASAESVVFLNDAVRTNS
jgi:hypothetical protein